MTPLRARAFRKRKKVVIEPWPVLLPSDWMKVCLESPDYKGFYVLGGFTLDELPKAEDMFERFWARHQFMDHQIVPSNPRRTIPVYIHGDEGRGLVKRPILILAMQPIISAKGESYCNSQGHHALYLTYFFQA